ncbi:hypothetical protein MML48_5g00005482 [Holotrichia oblita]|uniref:Uncharacterized protein n=1 Tax=Holotrichia oblita TaxID=644536 RepID=A0ACB9T553_HOLOL|nr:hypothetical protein MML48_5g00005482 [Holotrichia oblita]
MSQKIKFLENIIAPHLQNNQKIISCDFDNLLSAGENYGSVMLQITIKLQNDNGDEENIYCVGKTVPPSEMLWNLFNTKITFKKEIAIYKTIVPELNKYGEECGVKNLIKFTAKCFGARISLDPSSEEVDHDAVILLENLKTQNYKVCDRLNGFDEECSKLLLGDLATMHAAVIGYKYAQPESFEKKIYPFLKKAYAFNVTESFADNFAAVIKNACAKNPDCIPHLHKITKALREINYYNENPVKGKDIFATLTHNDYWVNNTLLKFEDGKPIANKMVDFQLIEYSSLAHDVIFFLYTSVNMDVIENKVDELIKFYYDKFMETLTKLGHPTTEYSFESMLEEFAIIAKYGQFSHLLYMFVPICMLKGKVKSLSKFDLNELIFEESSMHENYFRRMQFTLIDFSRRGWI